MSKQVDFEKYAHFVNAVTSDESKNGDSFTHRIADLYYQDFPVERMLTAAVGLSAEAGEFTEIVKKILFQGKPVNQENMFHLKRELGDIMWYIAQACIALGISLEDVLDTNIQKLEARYPDGFEAFRSENRKEGDI